MTRKPGEEFGPVPPVGPGPAQPRLAPLSLHDVIGLQQKLNAARIDLDNGQTHRAAATIDAVLDGVAKLRETRRQPRGEPAAPASDLSVLEASARSLKAQLEPPDPMSGGAGEALGRALEVLRLVATSGSDNPRAWADYGATLDLLGHREDAVLALDTAIRQGDPSSTTGRRLAGLLIADGRGAEAERVLRHVLTVESGGSAATLELLARSFEAQNKKDEASKAYVAVALRRMSAGEPDPASDAARRAVELEPASVEASLVLGDALRLLSDAAASVTALDRVLAVAPGEPRALKAKADVLRVAGDPEGSLEALDQLVAQDPDDPFVLGMKGDVLRMARRYPEALEVLERAVAHRPEDAWNVGTRGQVLRAMGRIHEARAQLRAATRLDPFLSWVWAELASVELDRDAPDVALAAAERALELDPATPPALAVVGRVHAQRAYVLRGAPSDEVDVERVRAEDEGALRAFTRLTEVNPDLAWAWLMLAHARLALGDEEGALAAARRSVTDVAGDQDAVELLVDLLLRSGRPELTAEALSLLAEPATRDDAAAWLLRLRGTALRLSGEPQAAVEVLTRAVGQAPDEVTAHLELARALVDLEQTEAALRSYAAALRLPDAPPGVLDEAAAITDLNTQGDTLLRFLDELLVARPDYLEARRQALRVHLAMGRYADVLSLMQAAGEETEWTAEDRCAEGEALRLLERPREARTAFRAALDEDDDYVPALTGMLYVYLDLGKPERARAFATRAIAGDRAGNPSLLADVALVDLASGDFDAALAGVGTAVDADPDNEWARLVRGRVLVAIGEWAPAAEAMAPLASVRSPAAPTLGLLAMARTQAGLARAAVPSVVAPVLDEDASELLRDARAGFERASELDTGYARYRQGLAYTADLLGRRDQALEIYRGLIKEIVSKRSYDSERAAVLAWCYCAMGEFTRAAKVYIDVIASASPDQPYLHFDLGLALLQGSQPELAAAEYRRGLAVPDETPGARQRLRTSLLAARNGLAGAALLGRLPSQGLVRPIVDILERALATLPSDRAPGEQAGPASDVVDLSDASVPDISTPASGLP
jgi:tetratricopeptide (TPR) repeat protein